MKFHSLNILGHKPINIWGLDLIDGKTLHQFLECMDPPWVRQGALMPDAHFGYTMPIGAVIETDCHVVPAWVGYDIGCGVAAIQTTFKYEDIERIGDKLQSRMKVRVPNGVGVYREVHCLRWPDKMTRLWEKTSRWFKDTWDLVDGSKQLGSLGAGNHYLEVCQDSFGNVSFVVHCGSRGIGHKTAEYYISMAEGSNLDGFHVTSRWGEEYLADHDFLLEFANFNRLLIMERMADVCNNLGLWGDLQHDTLINNTHNHCISQGAGRYVHRKGATIAYEDDLSVVAGNSQIGSFIVRGRGNVFSMSSCSHGAGRKMGRRQAKRELKLIDFNDDMGNVHADIIESRLDEAPRAYKDPTTVMNAQLDLCMVESVLTPIINVKGGGNRNG